MANNNFLAPAKREYHEKIEEAVALLKTIDKVIQADDLEGVNHLIWEPFDHVIDGISVRLRRRCKQAKLN